MRDGIYRKSCCYAINNTNCTCVKRSKSRNAALKANTSHGRSWLVCCGGGVAPLQPQIVGRNPRVHCRPETIGHHTFCAVTQEMAWRHLLRLSHIAGQTPHLLTNVLTSKIPVIFLLECYFMNINTLPMVRFTYELPINLRFAPVPA